MTDFAMRSEPIYGYIRIEDWIDRLIPIQDISLHDRQVHITAQAVPVLHSAWIGTDYPIEILGRDEKLVHLVYLGSELMLLRGDNFLLTITLDLATPPRS